MIFSDTIAAVSSAAGPAGRSIVRMSGPEAIELAEGVFSEPMGELGGFRSLDGTVAVQTPGPITVPARAYLFRGPRSYTRQDIVELHLPGEVVASVVCSALIDAGARQADAGEFTARAFLSGRLDLSAAQAVADVIDAQADAQLRSALGVLDGALARLCRPAAETLTETLAVTEASIDFADENLALAAPGELASTTRKVADDLDTALATSGRWSAAENEIRVAIAGQPNAGKSSLLNALGGVDRAIISAMSGTTRDVLSAPATLTGNLEVMLLDAAGLEAFAENPDPLTLAAHRAAREAIQSADAVLFVIDATAGDHNTDKRLLDEVVELNPRAPLMILANKIDLCNSTQSTDKSQQMSEVNLPETDSCISNVRQDRPEGPKDVSRGRKPPDIAPEPFSPEGATESFANNALSLLRGFVIRDIPTGGLRPRLNSTAPLGPNGILLGLNETLHRRTHKDVFPISALTGAGLDNLREVLADRLDTSAAPKPGTLLLHSRQRRGISKAAAAARRSSDMFAATDEITDVAELAAVELRSALAALAELTGQVADEDILSSIFARFCVGK